MLYREMPKTGEKLSILGFGCMRLPSSGMNVDEEEAIAQIRYAADTGINYFDTAWPYHGGKSETVLGKALSNGYREKVKIADKLPHWLCSSKDDMEGILQIQLERLGIEQIDYYLIHALDGSTWEKAKSSGVIDFIEEAKKRGDIKYAGFSFHGARNEFKAIINDYPWDFCQIQFNILDENAQAGIEGLDYAYSKGIGVIVMEPLRGGALAGRLPREVETVYRNHSSDRTNVEWALRWIWNHPGIITVLSGMNTYEQIDENITIAGTAEIGALDEKEKSVVREAADTFRSLMKVPCTACQYCMPCPKGVNIPLSFSFYNNKYLFGDGFSNRLYYFLQQAGIQGGKPALASQCVSCGKCVKHCPQKIAIPEELKKVEKEFEGLFSGILKRIIKLFLRGGKKQKA